MKAGAHAALHGIAFVLIDGLHRLEAAKTLGRNNYRRLSNARLSIRLSSQVGT
jgi:hypothetical protein